MTDRELMLATIEDITNTLSLVKTEEFPLDEKNTHPAYHPDSWMSVMFKSISNRLLLIVELQGDGLPIVSCEMNADPTLIADILCLISKAFGRFQTTNPCYHRGTGIILCGEEAAVAYASDRLAEVDNTILRKLGSKPPSGLYN